MGGVGVQSEWEVGGGISGRYMQAGLSPHCNAGRSGDGGRAALAEQQQRLQAAGELTPEVCVDLETDGAKNVLKLVEVCSIGYFEKVRSY